MTDDTRVGGSKPIVRKIHLPFGDISVFESLDRDLRFQNRFTPSSATIHLVDELIKYASRLHVTDLTAGQDFYRARVHPFNWGEIRPDPLSPKEMAAPPPEKATPGRLNPEGIPYLYVTTDESTAIAEVRPWQKAAVSVARLRLVRDLQVVNLCRSVPVTSSATKLEDWEQGAKFTWDMVCDFFAIPHHPGDSLRYLTTQYLAEAFKAAKFDGVQYDSSLSGSGQNIALFDCLAASVEEVRRIKVIRIQYDFQ
jgi:hypothetical protein